MSRKPIKVLQVVPSLNRSAGVARVVYNWHQFHDESRVHFDYLHHSSRNGVLMHDSRYDEELKADGSQVYTVNYASDDFTRFFSEIKSLFKEIAGEYDIVHCHMPNSAFVVLKEAKKAGINNRILHSHLNSSSDKIFHRIRNIPLNAWGKMYANDYAACSEEAGRFLFGSKSFTVINNGIALDDYRYNYDDRLALRAQLGIKPEETVIGCVGRFVKQKNYEFAIQVFTEFHRLHPHSKLLILGDGDERATLEALVKEEGLSDSVILPGVRNDINRIYSAMDIFFMPSLYEGLPVSAVEAQAAGLPCVYSRNVPQETDITCTGKFLPLSADMSRWVRNLEHELSAGRHGKNPSRLEANGYSVEANAELLMQHYEELLEGSSK